MGTGSVAQQQQQVLPNSSRFALTKNIQLNYFLYIGIIYVALEIWNPVEALIMRNIATQGPILIRCLNLY